MRKKLLALTILLAVAIGISGAIAALTYQQTLTIQGTTKYPLNTNTSPTPTTTGSSPTSGTSSTIQFSLFFSDGSVAPSTWSNPNFVAVVRSVAEEKGFGAFGPTLLLKNTGDVPLTVTAVTENVQVPSDIQLDFFYTVTNTDGTAKSTPVAVGETVAIVMIAYLVPTSQNYVSQATLNYNFGVTVSATSA